MFDLDELSRWDDMLARLGDREAPKPAPAEERRAPPSRCPAHAAAAAR